MHKIKILMIEDRKIMRDTIKILLKKTNEIEIVSEADNGEEGLERAIETSADVILLDINLPFMNGFEVAEKVLKINPDKKVLVYSIHNSEYYVAKMFNLGVKGYALKDDSFDFLVEAIKAVYKGKTIISNQIEFKHIRKENLLQIPLQV
ncbi:MAG: response regulator transcription factor [Bacteroidetes bacterium]|nr:DNA-binding response regulator [Bacteroidota bacterium]MBV6462299.1 Transcriptional regulatory protein DegU [Flavobacteriales bacterium]WKZ74881.1 MAG: response regulator transcription factor [Vicingaceae bacterium]MCL4816105.1 response regulator transcription factor [Flavobacteriales bacterium]NOG95264.1 response regulator transcription factor [Bacteroidota bacterium]